MAEVCRKMRIISLMFGLLLTAVACQSQAPIPTATSEPTCVPFDVNDNFRIRDVIIYVDEIFWSRSIPENVTVTKATGGVGSPSILPPYSDPEFLSQSPVSLESMDEQTRQDFFRRAYGARSVETDANNNSYGYLGCVPFQVVLRYEPDYGTFNLSYSLGKTWSGPSCEYSGSQGRVTHLMEGLENDAIPLDMAELIYKIAWPDDGVWECGGELLTKE